MQGRSLVAGLDLAEPAGVGYSSDEEATVRDRLSGLGIHLLSPVDEAEPDSSFSPREKVPRRGG